MGNLKAIVFLTICALCVVSCEKPEGESEFIDTTKQEEGFKSKTGNNNTVLKEDQLESVAEPILSVHFDDDVSKEEAFAIFDEKVADFMSTYKNESKGVSTEWFYRIWTYTGTQTNNETDGTVNASVYFNTDKGGKHTAYLNLNNPGDDREGGWDAYLFRTSIAGQAVSWVDAKHAHIRLKGTDGWFIKHFYVYVQTAYQSISSTGFSYIVSHPDVWLDNTNNNTWDYYNTGTIGTGRLNF